MTDFVIRTDAIGKLFRGKPAVRDVSLHVERGSVYAFLGPNGAGKSTTIRMLLGLLRPSSGDISVLGLDLRRHRSEILARVGSLVESPSLYEHLTARENLEIPRRILDAPRSDIDRVLGIAGLENAGGKLVGSFSLGMKQRLGLAQALLGERELLILDEPTNGLDPSGIQEMRLLIRQLPTTHGVTVFLSSHMLSEVEQVATHVGVLSQGEMVYEGTIGELAGMRQSCLRIGVNDPGSAAVLLTRHGWDVERAGEYLMSLDTGAGAAINRTLVEGGFAVHHLAVESISLEEVFLKMTRAEVA
ncbi:MAG: ABC transporter ATP-binding protein [Bryobacteraceae bacterium]